MRRSQTVLLVGVGLAVLGALSVGGIAIADTAGSAPVQSATNGTVNVSGTIEVVVDEPISHAGPPQLDPSLAGPPTDPDSDGRYEDLNGNGLVDFDDVVQYFRFILDPAITEYVDAYDYNGNGRIDFADIVTLFIEI